MILTELLGAIGFIRYSGLRTDSAMREDFTSAKLSAVDELLVKLVYHPQIKCNMNQSACEEVIRKLYY